MAGPKLDNVPLDHFEKELKKDIDSQKIYESGYSIVARVYAIPFIPGTAHTTLELHGPKRPDGTHLYADIDTYSMNHKGEATGYIPGSEMRMAIDQNRDDNKVTIDSNLLQSTVLKSGTGTDMLLEFTKMAEQAKQFNATGSQYHPLSIDGYMGMSKEEWANSNSGPRQILDNLGYDTHHIGGPKPHEGGVDMHSEFAARHWKPGSDDEVSRDFKKGGEYFKDYPGNSARLVQDPAELAKVNQLFNSLHPDYIAAHDPEMGGAPAAAIKPQR